MKSLNELLTNAKNFATKRIAIACPEEKELLRSIIEASQMGLGEFLLFGDEAKIKEILDFSQVKLPNNCSLINATDNIDACSKAVLAVRNQDADILMKGLVDTSILLKQVLNKEYGIRTGKLLSHVMVCELPYLKRFVLLSDGAMNIDPNVEQLKDITMNAVDLAHALGISKPKVAILSAVEKVNPKMPSTLKAEALKELWKKGVITGCELDGPLAVDGALSMESVRIKNIQSSVAGCADILIAPFIEVGNALYKGWMFGCEGPKSAGIIMGASAPIVLTSRADSSEAKIYSLALAIYSLNKE